MEILRGVLESLDAAWTENDKDLFKAMDTVLTMLMNNLKTVSGNIRQQILKCLNYL